MASFEKLYPSISLSVDSVQSRPLIEPQQPNVRLFGIQMPVFKACLVLGLVIILSVFPQLATVISGDHFTFINAFYFYALMFIVFPFGFGLIGPHIGYKKRQFGEVLTFVPKGAKSGNGFVLIMYFIFLVYMTCLWVKNAQHILSPFDKDGKLNEKFLKENGHSLVYYLGAPMSGFGLLYALIQFMHMAYGAGLLFVAREFSATHKVYVRLVKILGQEQTIA